MGSEKFGVNSPTRTAEPTPLLPGSSCTSAKQSMPSNSRSQLLVIWVIWFSMFVAVFIYQFALGGGIPVGENAHEQKMDVPVIISLRCFSPRCPFDGY